jgi:hypothetical protein
LESDDRRRPRGARRHGDASGADHRLHRRLQAPDDRDARRDPAAPCLQEPIRQARNAADCRSGMI